MGIVDAVEDLERAKSKLDDLKFEAEANEKWDLAEALEGHIEEVQSVIDSLSDDELFVSKPAESDDMVICDHAESCTQKLVVCEHQTLHVVKRIHSAMKCTVFGSCAVAEIECKCIKQGE